MEYWREITYGSDRSKILLFDRWRLFKSRGFQTVSCKAGSGRRRFSVEVDYKFTLKKGPFKKGPL